MQNYVYTALDARGKDVKGNIAAETYEDAVAKIKAKNITPLKVEVATALNSEVNLALFEKKPKPDEMAMFCRQVVSVLSAGVTVVDAFEMIADQVENKVLAEAISGCKVKMETGATLHESMQYYSVFPDVFCTMVAAGEASGSLEISFTRMAERFEKDAKLKGLIKKATMYPKVISVVLVGVVIFMLEFVVPKFTDLLGQMGSELPGLTKAVVGTSEFIKNHFLLILVLVIGLVVGFSFFKKSDTGKHILDKILLKLPVVGPLQERTACANTTRTLSTMLATGIPMIEAIQITSDVMTNVYFKEALQEVKRAVSIGTPLSEAFAAESVFPPMISHMAKIGEETGDLVGMFDRISDYYDERVRLATEQLTAMLEPMVIVAMAGVVGTIVISLMLPMVNMYSSLDNV